MKTDLFTGIKIDPRKNGYGEGENPFGDCCVAVSCYGRNSYITNSLRDWRDQMLQSGSIAHLLFIRAYYAFIGGSGAWLLDRLPFLKPVARRLILVFIAGNHIPLKS